jgi:YD repeat-containing protein
VGGDENPLRPLVYFGRRAGGSPGEITRYAYAYDRGGNRTTEQVDDGLLSTTHDGMNRMLAQAPGGLMRIAGSIDEAGLVNVDHRAATMDANNGFFVAFPLIGGLNTFTVRATDASGNLATQAYQYTVGGGSRTFTHDANGNLTSDGVRTFEWDAVNRLVAVEEGTQRVEYTYNGIGQRTQSVKKTGGVTDWTRRLVYADTEILEERDAAGTESSSDTRHRVKEGSDAYFYTRDHLGSLVNLTDASLSLRARYAYDPYGRGTRTAGNRDADIRSGHTSRRMKPRPDRLRDVVDAVLQARLAVMQPKFRALARRIRERDEWDDVSVDGLCTPPVSFTFGSVIGHILTVSVVRCRR